MIEINNHLLHIFFVLDPEGHPLLSKHEAVAKQDILC